MSYTLRGRLESRLAAVALPLGLALVLSAWLRGWWPLELAALMIGIGLALDLAVYHRAFAYQAGWLALPLGLVELALVMGAARALGVAAPLRPALAFYAAAWLAAQILGHALLPLWRLSYAEDGGELGQAGPIVAAAVLVALAGTAGTAYAMRPPTVHLHGVVRGPLVLDHPQVVVGGIVRGGVIVRSNDVTLRDVRVIGGENGIDVDTSDRVVLDGVSVTGATLDGIHIRRSSVAIRDCTIHSSGAWTQGIDISYSFDHHMSSVERCTVTGGREGIVTHFTMAKLARNRVSGTSLRGIAMTEMSMGHVERNHVTGSLGVGIYCGDHSVCTIERNVVAHTRADTASGDASRAGYGIEAHNGAEAELSQNSVASSPAGIGAFVGAHVERRR